VGEVSLIQGLKKLIIINYNNKLSIFSISGKLEDESWAEKLSGMRIGEIGNFFSGF